MRTLHATSRFPYVTHDVDEQEHSLEMQYPYLCKVYGTDQVEVVPILVGTLTAEQTRVYARILAPLLADPRTVAVVSSDFCHWGKRFRYTPFADGQQRMPLYECIQELDAEGMTAISFAPQCRAPLVHTNARAAAAAFRTYLADTHNTICGRNPIALLLSTLALMEDTGDKYECCFTHYRQSSAVTTPADSSVSYAAACIHTA